MDTQSIAELRTVEVDWPAVLTLLPPGLEESAREAKAFVRRREITSASVLLRLAMAYCLSRLSLDETAAWAAGAGLARISGPDLWKRLRNCAPWLGDLLTRKLKERISLCRSRWSDLRIRLMDATSVCRPGSTGSDWHIHLGLDLASLQIDHAELTNAKTGETLARMPLSEGDVAVCDRGYSSRKGIWSVVCAKAYVIVRLSWLTVPLLNSEGNDFDILERLRDLDYGEAADFQVTTKPSKPDKIPAIPGRLIAVRKSPQKAEEARRKLNTEKKRQGRTPDARSLEACDYVFVFTTLPVERVPAEEVLDIYRLRWQIEMAFKRMKSILYLDEMATRDDQLCQTFLLTKLLGALVVEDLSRRYGAFSPWGYGCPSSAVPVASMAVVG